MPNIPSHNPHFDGFIVFVYLLQLTSTFIQYIVIFFLEITFKTLLHVIFDKHIINILKEIRMYESSELKRTRNTGKT